MPYREGGQSRYGRRVLCRTEDVVVPMGVVKHRRNRAEDTGHQMCRNEDSDGTVRSVLRRKRAAPYGGLGVCRRRRTKVMN